MSVEDAFLRSNSLNGSALLERGFHKCASRTVTSAISDCSSSMARNGSYIRHHRTGWEASIVKITRSGGPSDNQHFLLSSCKMQRLGMLKKLILFSIRTSQLTQSLTRIGEMIIGWRNRFHGSFHVALAFKVSNWKGRCFNALEIHLVMSRSNGLCLPIRLVWIPRLRKYLAVFIFYILFSTVKRKLIKRIERNSCFSFELIELICKHSIERFCATITYRGWLNSCKSTVLLSTIAFLLQVFLHSYPMRLKYYPHSSSASLMWWIQERIRLEDFTIIGRTQWMSAVVTRHSERRLSKPNRTQFVAIFKIEQEL